MMATVYVGLGSNIEPEQNLKLGIAELRRRYGEVDVSAVYRSAAVGFEGEDFLNLVGRFESESEPVEICQAISAIHKLVGRDRRGGKWESRPLDIDLLLYNDRVMEEPRVPRGDVLEYSFVLRPLAELAPDLRHPETGRTMLEHWQEFDASRHPLEAVDVTL
jgi:2-amino-4-hydroxy-6-hydroxymethyldihydropteridine diphosphokinase